jgi:hypothetical protein
MSRLNRLLGFPRRSLQLLAGGVPRLDRLTEESRRGVKVGAEVLKKTDALRQKVDGLDQDIHALRDDVGTLRRELHDRMLQYHHQLGRLARAVDASHATDDVRLSGRSIPVETPAADEPPWSAIGDACGPDTTTPCAMPAASCTRHGVRLAIDISSCWSISVRSPRSAEAPARSRTAF